MWGRWRRVYGGNAPSMGADVALFSSIRRHLTLWYSGVLAAALVLFGVALYVGVDRALLGPIDDNLATRAHRLAQSWQMFPFQRCPLRLALRPGTYWACFDKNGALARNSVVARAAHPFSTPAFARRAIGAGVAHDTVDGGPDVGPIDRYALAVPNASGHGLIGVVELGEGIRGQTDALHTLLVLLLIMGPVTFCGATVGGLFLAKSALAPARLAFARQQSFIADASHELRTPLTLLRADAEVLLRGRERLPAEDAELLEDIVAETAHMATLATNMLTLARLDAERLHLEREVVPLGAVAHAVTRRATALATAAGVALDERHTDQALVVGDRTLLEQAALILVDNAIKYNRPGGRVALQTGVAEGQAWLRVDDTGVGIPAEHLARLGERFYRVDKARSREAGGAGLGLSIARGIAVAHGGTLTLSSRPEEGTTAVLSLPSAQGEAGRGLVAR